MARSPAKIIGHDALTQLAFEGYVVLPIEPTDEMLGWGNVFSVKAHSVYQAMIKAAKESGE